MQAETCKIQWVDSSGNPTTDSNPAIGIAVYHRTESIGSQKIEQRFPICAEHANRMPHGSDVGWYPGTGETVSWWTLEKLED